MRSTAVRRHPHARQWFQSTGKMQYDWGARRPSQAFPKQRGDAMATPDYKTADTDEKIFIGKGEADGMAYARARKSARSRDRRDRNRQDRLAAGDGGGICAGWRSGFRCGHQGRPVGHLRGRRGQGLHRQAGRRDGPGLPARPVLDGVLGRVRRAGASGPRHRHRNGAAVVVPDAGPERRAGRRPQCRVPCRRRERPDLDRYEGSPRASGCDRSGCRQKVSR